MTYVDLSTLEMVEIASAEEVDQFDVSPVDGRIAFVEITPSWTTALSVMDADGRNRRQILALREGGGISEWGPPIRAPAWSPDGRKIAFYLSESGNLSDEATLCTINADGNDLRKLRRVRLTAPDVSFLDSWIYNGWIAWSPDGERIAYVDNGWIWTIPADGGPAVEVATIAGDFFLVRMPGLSLISPDLSRVAYTAPPVGTEPQDLIIANLDGSDAVIYDSGNIRWAGWSPDGARFLYMRNNTLELFLGGLGLAPVPIGPGRDARWLDPQTFVYNAQLPGGGWDLVRYSIATGPTVLAHNPDRPLAFAISRP